MTADTAVRHRWIEMDGMRVFVREAGSPLAPAVLLPHGYPCSSYEFRNLMPLLADKWRLVAPDFPGCGLSDTPDGFRYDFDGYAEFLSRLATRMGMQRFVMYCHDFGGYIGMRLGVREPERIAGLIIQNADIYEDTFGRKYDGLKAYWDDPTPEKREELGEAISEEGFRDEFLNDVEGEIAERISPDLWALNWAQTTPKRKDIYHGILAGLKENLEWFPRYQTWLRERRPPALIVWGPNDGYLPEGAARSFLRVLPDAELHLTDGGHWLLETHLDEVAPLIRRFLERVDAQESHGHRMAAE